MSRARMVTGAAILGTVAVFAVAQGQAVTQPTVVSAWVDLQAARGRLIADPGMRGKTVLAGVELTLSEGWKTYWRMPGEAGVPPTFDWAGSSNVAAVNVLYPAPMRLPEPAAMTVGYKHAVIFPVEVTPHDASKPVVLKLAMDLGVCREICIPAQATMSLTVPAGNAAATPSAQMTAALDRVPRRQAARRPGDPELVGVTARLDGPAPRLLIEARFSGEGKGADLFIEAPDGLFVPLPTPVDAGRDTVRFEVDLARSDIAKDLKGKVLTLTLVSEAGATEATWMVP